MAFVQFEDKVLNQHNAPVSGAKVYVYGQDGQLAELRNADGSALTNPLTSDQYGGFSGYAEPGLYTLSFHYGGAERLRDFAYQVGVGLPLPDSVIDALGQAGGANYVGKTGGGTVQDYIDDLGTAGASTGAAMAAFLQSGTGAQSRDMQAKGRDICDALDFIPSGQHAAIFAGTSDYDAGPDLVKALAASSFVNMSRPGLYRVDETVEVGTDGVGQKGLYLGQDVRVSRPASSSETTPLFWLKYDQSFVKGAGLGSRIMTANRAPDGLILVGHEDMATSHANVMNCEASGLWLSGAQNYGQTTGDPDVLVKLCNPQLGGLASYFHRIRNLRLQGANYGIHLQGYANCNFIDDIEGWYIGNGTLSTHRALIFLDGAQENMIGKRLFLHYSPGSSCLKFRDNDNTGTSGGSSHVPHQNMIDAITEQDPSPDGGLGIDAPDTGTTAAGNIIRLIDNCPANDIGADFGKNNDIQTYSLGSYIRKARLSGNLDFNDAATDKKIRFSVGAGGDTIWRLGYEGTPAGAQVITGSAVMLDVYNGAAQGFGIRDYTGTSLVEVQGSTGSVFAKGKLYPGADEGAIQTSCGILAGSGAPDNANGANGDYYLRSDGTASGKTCLYHKESGSWVAVVP